MRRGVGVGEGGGGSVLALNRGLAKIHILVLTGPMLLILGKAVSRRSL